MMRRIAGTIEYSVAREATRNRLSPGGVGQQADFCDFVENVRNAICATGFRIASEQLADDNLGYCAEFDFPKAADMADGERIRVELALVNPALSSGNEDETTAPVIFKRFLFDGVEYDNPVTLVLGVDSMFTDMACRKR